MSQGAFEYRNKQARRDRAISALLITFGILWLFPLIWTLWSSLRPYSEVLNNGMFTISKKLSLTNYSAALEKMSVIKYFINTIIILFPSVFFILLFGSLLAFSISKYHIKHKKLLLLAFTAGSMLPAQAIYYPIFKMYIFVGSALGSKTIFYDNYLGVILVHIALQTGFATFVLHSQLESIPKELSEAAQVDGASVLRHYWSVILPMLKAPLIALGITMSVWIYNDFFWAWSLLKRDQFFPITTSLTRVGAFARIIPDPNVLAAGSVLVALPLLILYLFARRYFSMSVMLAGGRTQKLVSPDHHST
ncbi:UgpE ABC-type sugar transport system, permease component [Candidatus Nanopelagicaceae bacterium]